MENDADVDGQQDPPRVDRPRSVLTKADRRYLLDLSDLEPQSHGERRARERIRERVVNAFLDLSIIEQTLEKRDRKLIFDAFDSNKIHPEESRLYGNGIPDHLGALTDTLAFIYRETKDSEGRYPPFEQLLEHAIMNGEADPGAIVLAPYSIELTIEKQHDVIDINTIIDRVESGNTSSLSEYEMKAFLQFLSTTDGVDTDTIREEATQRAEQIQEGRPPGSYPFRWMLSEDASNSEEN